MAKSFQDIHCKQCNRRTEHITVQYSDRSGAGLWIIYLGMRAFRRTKQCTVCDRSSVMNQVHTYEISKKDLERFNDEVQAEVQRLRVENDGLKFQLDRVRSIVTEPAKAKCSVPCSEHLKVV